MEDESDSSKNGSGLIGRLLLKNTNVDLRIGRSRGAIIENFSISESLGEFSDAKNDWDIEGSSDIRGFFGCLHKGMIDWLVSQNASAPSPGITSKKELLQLLRDETISFENYYRIFRTRLRVIYHEIYIPLIIRAKDLCEQFSSEIHQPLTDLVKWCSKIKQYLPQNPEIQSQFAALEIFIAPAASNLNLQVENLYTAIKMTGREHRDICPIIRGKAEVEKLKCEYKSAFYEIIDALMASEDLSKPSLPDNLMHLLSKPNKNLFSLSFMTLLAMRNTDKSMRKGLNELISCKDAFWTGFDFVVHEKAQVIDRIKLLQLHVQDEAYHNLLLHGTELLNKLREKAAYWSVGRQLDLEVKEFVVRFTKKGQPGEKWSRDALKKFAKQTWFNFPNKPSLVVKCIGVFTITGTSNLCLLIIDVGDN
jgi:hypothetical protein